MSWAIVVGAGVSLAGSAIAANSASDSADAQAGVVGQSSAANIALAREQRARNEALFAQYLGDENMARAYLDALHYGTGSYTPGAPVPGSGSSYAGPTPVSYPLYDTNGNLLSTDPLRPEQMALYAQQGIRVVDSTGRAITMPGQEPLEGEDAEGEEPAEPITITRDQVMALIEGTPLSQFANADFAAREGLAGDTYAGARDLADDEYDALTGAAGDAREGRRGVALDNLNRRIGLEDDSYAAWMPLSQAAEDDAINLNFSRGGVTGLVGATRRGVGETTQDAAMERNLRRLEGLQRAHEPYFGDVTGAEDSYWEDVLATTGLRGDRYQRGYDRYSATRGANYDQFAGDRLNSYADYTGFLTDRANRGFSARGQISSGGQQFVNAASDANSRAAEAASASYARQGQIQQQLYGDLAEVAGGLAGSIFNRKK